MDKMNDLYQINAKQVGSYSDFISNLWETGGGNDQLSAQILKILVESPELSEKLLSVLFYYDPQNGKLLQLMPRAYIGQFLDNIRNMLTGENVDYQEAFQKFIMAFEQLNAERSAIVNNQGQVLTDFAEKMANYDKKLGTQESGFGDVMDYLRYMKEGTLFSKVDSVGSFMQLKAGDAKSQDLDSVTGKSFGSNSLFEFKEIPGGDTIGTKTKDFEAVQPPPPKEEKVQDDLGQLIVPNDMTVDVKPPSMEQPAGSTWDDYMNHIRTRQELAEQKIDEDKIDEMGYRIMSYDEFKALHKKNEPKKTPEQTIAEKEKEEQDKAKRMATIRLAKDIQAFHNQGKEAGIDGFVIGGSPSTIKIPMKLTQDMLLYGPSWRQVNGASNISDDEILLQMDSKNKVVQERIRKAKEAEQAKQEEERRQKQREQQILDYSAKVNGGFIEVKVGEDVEAMRESYFKHIEARQEAAAKGISEDKIDEMGLKLYTWEEWKRYYRKMHGLPEDGIKRIPFEGKRKERKIDWNTRYALSTEELAKYGIQVSEDGPVMIPLEKAMEVSNSLLKGAKTIHSVRDGLEVMKEGLVQETQNLKKRREGGVPIAVVSNPIQPEQTVEPQPDNTSST